MSFLPLSGTATVAYSRRFIPSIYALLRQSLKNWRARARDGVYFASLNDFELERQARDVGLSRTELLGHQPHPTRRSYGALEIAQRCRSETSRRARLIRLMGA